MAKRKEDRIGEEKKETSFIPEYFAFNDHAKKKAIVLLISKTKNRDIIFFQNVISENLYLKIKN